MFDTSAASNVLKVFYLPPVRELLNNATILLSRIEKDSTTQDVSGTSFTVPLHITRNEAAGVGRAENGDLPTAASQGYEKAVVPNKYIYGRIQISGPVIAATKNSTGAFVRAIESEMKGLLKDTKRAVNRQLHGDGLDALGYFVSGAGSTTTYVDDNLGSQFSHFVTGQATTVDLLDASSSYATLNAAVTATQGAWSSGNSGYLLTLGAAASGSAVDGDPYVVASTKDKQMMGIQGIIDNADPVLLAGGLHGLPVATKPYWVAQVVGSDSTLQDLSFPLLQQLFTAIASNSDFSESDIKFLLTSYQGRDKYVELCVNERRFYNTMTLDGGFEAVDFNGKPIVPDSQCRRKRFYAIVPETLRIFRSADFDWMDRDGSTFSRVSGKDAYEATLFHYGDLGCVARNGNGVLKGINM